MRKFITSYFHNLAEIVLGLMMALTALFLIGFIACPIILAILFSGWWGLTALVLWPFAKYIHDEIY